MTFPGKQAASFQRGVPSALLSAALFGSSTFFAKLLVGEVHPALLAGLLYVGSAAGLGLWMILRNFARMDRSEAALTRPDVPWLAGAILFGGVLAPLLLMIGLTRSSASTASLLLNMEGVFTALLAWFAFRENFDRRIALGMVLITTGSCVLSWTGGRVDPEALTGSLAIVAACLCWGIDNNFTRRVSAADPVQSAAIKGAVAGPVNVAIALALGSRFPAGSHFAFSLLVGLFGYGASLVLFIRALRDLGTARTGAYFSTAPFLGAVLSIMVLREPVTPMLVAAAVLMGAGVWLHLTERHEHDHSHERMLHTHRHRHDDEHHHNGSPIPLEPDAWHTHEHIHEPVVHAHGHTPDIHHRHDHGSRTA
jgi:drug/metabolite transporter (DMT)-like permease